MKEINKVKYTRQTKPFTIRYISTAYGSWVIDMSGVKTEQDREECFEKINKYWVEHGIESWQPLIDNADFYEMLKSTIQEYETKNQ